MILKQKRRILLTLLLLISLTPNLTFWTDNNTQNADLLVPPTTISEGTNSSSNTNVETTNSWSLNLTNTTTETSNDDNALKKRSEILKTLFDKTEEEKLNRTKEEKNTKIEVNEALLKEIQEKIGSDITRLEKYIDENDKIKGELLLKKETEEWLREKLNRLELENKEYKTQLDTLKYIRDNTLPEKQLEIEFLKRETDLLLEKYSKKIVEEKDKLEREELFKYILLIGWTILLVILKLCLIYYKKKKKPSEDIKMDKHIYQKMSVYHFLITIFFYLIIYFIFKPEALVYLIFIWSSLILIWKDYILNFLWSIRSTKVLSVWSYVTYKEKKWLVTNLWILDFTMEVLDKKWQRTGDILFIPNMLVWTSEITISDSNILEESLIIEDIELFSLEYNELIIKLKKFFKLNSQKFGKIDYEIIDTYEKDKRGLVIKWKYWECDDKWLIKKKLLDDIMLDKYKIKVLEISDYNLVQKINSIIKTLKYTISSKKDYYEYEFKITPQTLSEYEEIEDLVYRKSLEKNKIEI